MAEKTLDKEEAPLAEVTTAAETNGVADTDKLQAKGETGPKVVEIENVEIEIDLDLLLIGDLEVLGQAGEGKLSMTEMVPFLDRVVKDGVRHRPMRHLSQIVDALGEAISESANPKN